MKKQLLKFLGLVLLVLLCTWILNIKTQNKTVDHKITNKSKKIDYDQAEQSIDYRGNFDLPISYNRHKSKKVFSDPMKYLEAREIVTKRTSNSKTYQIGNNKYASRIYGGGIHYRDNSGLWKDINIHLKSSKNSKYAFENTTNSIQSFFPVELSNKNQVRLTTDLGSYTMGNKFLFSLVDDLTKEKEADFTVDLTGVQPKRIQLSMIIVMN